MTFDWLAVADVLRCKVADEERIPADFKPSMLASAHRCCGSPAEYRKVAWSSRMKLVPARRGLPVR